MYRMSMQPIMRMARVVSLVLLSVLGTTALMYAAPGYFTDAREMDATHGVEVRTELQALKQQQGSLAAVLRSEMQLWSHGDLGRSRQFDTDVRDLLKERAGRSLRLLASGVIAGWSAALLLAIPLSLRRGVAVNVGTAGVTALLLALPVGVLATLCLLGNTGGPVLVMALVVAARDFKVLYRLVKSLWSAPFILHARANGLSSAQLLRAHIGPYVSRELLSVVVMSFTLALSALVPVEVIFDVPGLGQLAWSAAMNRDLPVLAAVTGLMSACVGIAASLLPPDRAMEAAPCA